MRASDSTTAMRTTPLMLPESSREKTAKKAIRRALAKSNALSGSSSPGASIQ
jgi:hypothetical protein